MAKQTFTAGQVLTAAEMNSLQENDYNWTVTTKTASYTLAAGDEGTRIVMNNAGATTITVDDAVFAAGDSVRIHNIGAGACTITAGTATVNSTGALELAQYGGGELYFTSASSAIFFPFGGGTTMIKKVEAFTATGTWTVPTGVTYAIAHMLGGGGGGGGLTGGGATPGGDSSVAFASGTVTAPGGQEGFATAASGVASTTFAQANNSGRGGHPNATTTGSCWGGDAQWVVAGAAVTPAASITVTVGAGGTGDTSGTSNAGDGGSGYVWIEYYEEA